MLRKAGRRTSEGFCPVPLLGCAECWDQHVELPGAQTSWCYTISASLRLFVLLKLGFPPTEETLTNMCGSFKYLKRASVISVSNSISLQLTNLGFL